MFQAPLALCPLCLRKLLLATASLTATSAAPTAGLPPPPAQNLASRFRALATLCSQNGLTSDADALTKIVLVLDKHMATKPSSS